MKANNVISFPEGNVVRKIPRPDDLQAFGRQVEQNKKKYLDGICDHYSAQLISKLGMHGFEINNEDFIKNYAYTVEALRSTLYQSIGLYHPLKKHLDKCIGELEKAGSKDKS